METLFKYRAYSKASQQFVEQFEYKSAESLLVFLQLRFDSLSDLERETAAQDFKVLTDNINASWNSESTQLHTGDSHIHPFTFHSNHYIYFVDIVISS